VGQEKVSGKEEDDLRNGLTQVRTLTELREKWKGAMENQQREYEHFVRMSAMSFIPQKLVDRVNHLNKKIE
jgi:hypothetical protein